MPTFCVALSSVRIALPVPVLLLMTYFPPPAPFPLSVLPTYHVVPPPAAFSISSCIAPPEPVVFKCKGTWGDDCPIPSRLFVLSQKRLLSAPSVVLLN